MKSTSNFGSVAENSRVCLKNENGATLKQDVQMYMYVDVGRMSLGHREERNCPAETGMKMALR